MVTISVVMSVFNEEVRWVRESIDSILNQTFQDFEFIIVIDNPKLNNNLKDYLEAASKNDSRIHLIYNEINLGLAMSLNKGIIVASGTYIARMDADDISEPMRFEKELNYIKNHDCDMVSSNIVIINENSKEIDKSDDKPENPEKILPYSNVISHPSVLIKKSVLMELNCYRNFRKSQDYDLWLRLLTYGYKIRIINEVLLKYRIRSKSITTNGRLEQYYTNLYQKQLYQERLKNKKDSFSEERFKEYLKRKKITPRKNNKCVKSMKHLDKAKKQMVKKNPFFIVNMVISFFEYPEIAINGMKNTFRKERQ